MLSTVWGENLGTGGAEKELFQESLHPDPLWERKDWESLNGPWDFAVTKVPSEELEKDPAGIAGGPETFAFPEEKKETILVPFAPESDLSGIKRPVLPEDVLWYRRSWKCPEDGKRTILHFSGVDQTASVYVNGTRILAHTGGYLPFAADVTDCLHAGENEIGLMVRDVSDTSYHARGKQKLNRGGMYYTPVSGIWKDVWLERVPESFLEGAEIHPDLETGKASILVKASDKGSHPCTVTVYAPALFAEGSGEPDEGSTIGTFEVMTGERTEIGPVPVRRWSPEAPFLYFAKISLGTGTDRDEVRTYFAFRKMEIRQRDGIPRVFLNGEEIFQRGVLDQGYWPESLLTPPSDESMVFDIREMKRTGFNMVRKHIKIEPQRWYYHCDRLGILVWQDMVNGGSPYHDWYVTYLATPLSRLPFHLGDWHRYLLSRTDKAGREEFEREMEETVHLLSGHPSIVTWVLFNEGWGQFDTKRLTKKLKGLDPERPVDAASGWYDRRCGDFASEHNYFFRFRVRPEKKRAYILSEFGGKAYPVAGHCWNEDAKTYGYGTMQSLEELERAYDELDSAVSALREKGLCASVYTQWSDIEDEINGIYTYDRRVRKIRGLQQS